jgi:hypothetical protein
LTAFLEVVRSCCRRIGVRRSPSANKKRRRG